MVEHRGRDELFRFAGAMKRDPAVEAWMRAQRDELRPLVASWFGYLRACGDDVRELMHDGCATACAGEAAFAHVGAYKTHVSVYFFFGAELDDRCRLLEGTGKRGRHVALRPGMPVDEAALRRLVDTAYADVRARLRY